MTIYNKLVRDKIPEIIEKSGEIPHTRILDGEEYALLLENLHYLIYLYKQMLHK